MYCQERVDTICKAIERGETIENAARIGNIAVGTLFRWMDEKSEFKEAVKKAKAAYEDWEMNGILADAKKSLKTLICGTEYEEVKTEYENDKNDSPRIRKQTRVTKKILPNATAVIFALCNRDPEHWKNRISNELTGKVETETKGSVSLAKVPDELLAQVIEKING